MLSVVPTLCKHKAFGFPFPWIVALWVFWISTQFHAFGWGLGNAFCLCDIVDVLHVSDGRVFFRIYWNMQNNEMEHKQKAYPFLGLLHWGHFELVGNSIHLVEATYVPILPYRSHHGLWNSLHFRIWAHTWQAPSGYYCNWDSILPLSEIGLAGGFTRWHLDL